MMSYDKIQENIHLSTEKLQDLLREHKIVLIFACLLRDQKYRRVDLRFGEYWLGNSANLSLESKAKSSSVI